MKTCNILVILFICSMLFAAEDKRNIISLRTLIQNVLKNNAQLQIEQQRLDSAVGLYQARSGLYDSKVISQSSLSHTYPNGFFDYRSNTLEQQITFQKQTTSGITLSGTGSLTLATSNNKNLPKSHDFNPGASLAITLPLLRSWDPQVHAYMQNAALMQLLSSKYYHTHLKTQYVLRAVNLYWRYAAAWKKHILLQEAELRSQKLVHDIKILINKKERPASDLLLFEAYYTNISASRISAKEDLLMLINDIYLFTGKRFSPDITLPKPADMFPSNTPALDDKRFKSIHTTALDNSNLLKNLQSNIEAQSLTVNGLENKLHHTLDLSFSLSADRYPAGGELQNVNYPVYSGMVSLNYEYPFSNNSIKGELAIAKSQLRSAQIEKSLAAQELSYSLYILYHRINLAAEKVLLMKKATRLYHKTVENEKKKYANNMSTVIDVINTEDVYLNSLLSFLDNQINYVHLLAQLRFDSGEISTLISSDSFSVDMFQNLSLKE